MLFTRNSEKEQGDNPSVNDTLRDKRPQILRDLDDFNTADTANKGIMLGILEEQQNALRGERDDDQGSEEPREPKQAKPLDKAGEDKVDFSQHYAPLNSSIQDMRRHYEGQMDGLRDEIRSLRGAFSEQRQPAQSNVDPETPVTFGHMQSYDNRMKSYDQYLVNQAMAVQWLRCQNEYLMFKQSNPEYACSTQDLHESFKRYSSGDPNRVANVNWTGVFQVNHQQTAGPKLASERDQLKKENDTLKKELETLRKRGTTGTTRASAVETQNVSPALRSSGRTIQTVGAESDDIINLPSFKRGRSFKSYGNDLRRVGLIK